MISVLAGISASAFANDSTPRIIEKLNEYWKFFFDTAIRKVHLNTFYHLKRMAHVIKLSFFFCLKT